MDPIFIIVDLFCGFGGTTTGFMEAKIAGHNVCKVIACVNHDPKAIKSHWLNHPEVKHFEEDIRTLDLTELSELVQCYQGKYPDAKLILWASLECTNFSKAKGGQPREADSRTLADHLFRYELALQPDYVQIENVVEFMSWGPLDEKGKPVSRRNGEDWMKWRNKMCSLGYYDQWKEMNSADYGAYTSRNRLFGCFAKNDLPIVWPEPSHSKKGSLGMFAHLKKWKPVKDVLNFEDEGISIFTRKKPLSDKTLERIYAGLIKYIAKGDSSFISKYYSGTPSDKNNSVKNPIGTITTVDHHSLIQTDFLMQTYAGKSLKNVDEVANTITTRYHPHLVQPEFLLKYNSTDKKGIHTPPSINEPCPTIAAQARLGIVQPEFLTHYYGNGFCTSQEEPCPTLTTKERCAIVKPKFIIDSQLKNAQNQGIHQPAGTILPTDKHRIVEATPFIVNPSHGGHSTSTEAPCPVIIARQDKAPLYLVHADAGTVAIAVFDCDSEVMVRIKVFMSFYGLVDIKMRMLRVVELLKIQGFDEDYKMVGNQTDQKKFIGNSVHPKVPKAWAEVMAYKFTNLSKKAV